MIRFFFISFSLFLFPLFGNSLFRIREISFIPPENKTKESYVIHLSDDSYWQIVDADNVKMASWYNLDEVLLETAGFDTIAYKMTNLENNQIATVEQIDPTLPQKGKFIAVYFIKPPKSVEHLTLFSVLWISKIDVYIQLNDGSYWQPNQTKTHRNSRVTPAWKRDDPIQISHDNEDTSNYPYVLTNTRIQESVLARQVNPAIPSTLKAPKSLETGRKKDDDRDDRDDNDKDKSNQKKGKKDS